MAKGYYLFLRGEDKADKMGFYLNLDPFIY